MNLSDWQIGENEEPLERFLPNGGFCGIFRRIACVGDSLASGEFEIHDETGVKYYDKYEYSWGQYLARLTGSEVLNFSTGGMTAREYCETFADRHGYWARELAAQAYVIALGVNDLHGVDTGTIDDVDPDDRRNNKKTFAGYYGTIIQRYKEIQPDAFFFLITVPSDDGFIKASVRDAHNRLMYDFAERFSNCYVLDFGKYAPVYDDAFRKNFFLNGHMNPMGYLLTSRLVAAYIDYYIRKDPAAFATVGMIGDIPSFVPGSREPGFLFRPNKNAEAK